MPLSVRVVLLALHVPLLVSVQREPLAEVDTVFVSKCERRNPGTLLLSLDYEDLAVVRNQALGLGGKSHERLQSLLGQADLESASQDGTFLG